MTKLKLLFIFFIIFSRFFLISSLPSETLVNATNSLFHSGFVSMALTLQLVSETLLSNSSSATIFSPLDDSFIKSGQPSLSLLRYHFSPLAFPFKSLRSLPFGTEIPTMSSGQSLIVTTSASDEHISLNNVNITGLPIYDKGSLIIFGINNFFDPNFHVSSPIQSPIPYAGCVVLVDNPRPSSGGHPFDEASETLRSRGYSLMASFLDLQLPRPDHNKMMLTVFAPVDEVMKKHIGNFTEYPSLFLRHVLPCRLSWTELFNLKNGTMLGTYVEGFLINITQSDGTFTLNEVAVLFPDMYYSDWLVVHGLRDILTVPERSGQEAVPSSGPTRNYTQDVSASVRLKPFLGYPFSSP